MESIYRLSIKLLLILFQQCLSREEYTYDDISPLRDFLIVENNTLLLSGEGGIVSVQPGNLTKQHKTDGKNWLMVYNADQRTIVQCNQSVAHNISRCSELYLNLTFTDKSSDDMEVDTTYLPSYVISKGPESESKNLVIGATSIKMFNKTFGILTLDFQNQTSVEKLGRMNIELGPKNVVVFISVLNTPDHIYFFYKIFDQIGSSIPSFRVGRLCKNGAGINQIDHHPYQDMQLKCKVEGPTGKKTVYSDIVGAVSTVEDNNEPFVIILFNKKDDTSSVTSSTVCGFKKTVLDNLFRRKRIEDLKCGTNRPSTYFMQERFNLSSPNCTADNDPCTSDFCKNVVENYCSNTVIHTILAGYPEDVQSPLYNEANIFTTMKINKFEEFFLLYIGTENGYILTVYLSKADPQIPSHVKRHKVIDTQINKIETTNDAVLILIPEKVHKLSYEDCSIYENCTACLNSFNPYCGWNNILKRCLVSRGDHSEFIFITPDRGKCIELNVEPKSVLLFSDSKQDIPFRFKGPRCTEYCDCDFLNTNIPFVYNPASREVNECIATINTDMISTIIPGNFTFVLKFNGSVVASDQISLMKCEQFTSCTNCVATKINGRTCGWNVTISECKAKKYDIGHEGICPSIDIQGSQNTENLVYGNTFVNVSIPLIWTALATIPSLRCIAIAQKDMSIPTQEVTTETINHTVSCVGLNLTMGTGNSETNMKYEIRLKNQNGVYIDGVAIVSAFTCTSVLRNKSSCSMCKRLTETYPTICEWCSEEEKCYSSEYEKNKCGPSSNDYCNVSVSKILPKSGPIKGGTLVTLYGENFGLNESIIDVNFEPFPCTNISIQDDFTLTCITSSSNETVIISSVEVTIEDMSFRFIDNIYNWFEFKKPAETFYFSPNKSIQSGGRLITINGTNIGFEGQNRYYIEFCGSYCVECRVVGILGTDNIQCLSGNITFENVSYPITMTQLKVTIDNQTTRTMENINFVYLKDPRGIVLSNETSSVLQSGGAGINIDGEGFSNVGQVTIERVEKPCDIQSDTRVRCETPPYSGNDTIKDKVTESVKVFFDGLTVSINVQYTGDPTFEQFGSVLEYDTKSTIQIKGQRLLQGANEDDYRINIGLDGFCVIIDITNTSINCLPPKSVPRTTHEDENIVAVKVKVGKIKQYIGDLEYIAPLPVLIIIIVVLAVAFVIAVVSGVFATLTMRRKRKREIKQLVMELQTKEEMIKKKSREEFADAQLTLKVIQGDLVTSAVPYWDFNTYILLQLFPTQDPKSNFLVLYRQITDDDKGKDKSAFDKLDILLQNKLFLKSLIQTLDRPNKLTVQEKAQFGAVLSISLLGNMRLFYDLIQCLLAEKIKSSPKKQLKVLFRRFESITFRLIATWLHVTLYKQLVDKNGVSLFMLLRAVQTIIEREPIDDLTGNSKYTLAEEKLLKIRVEYETLTLNINLNGNSDHCFPVRVLDCDTISQVKRKCCLQIYKNTPGSEIPKFEELVLEWLEGKNGKLLLEDIDNTSERISGLVRLNTLKHYGVRDNCKMALLYGEHDDDELYMNYVHEREQVENVSADDIDVLVPGGSDKDEFNQKWHLESSASNLPDDEKSNMTHDIGEIYLNRLMHTKLLLSTYIDSTFEALMDIETVSTPIQFFLCMFDKLGKDYNIDDDILQIWKNECYGTRLWSPLIAKPQRIFDVHVPGHVEPVMDILSHVFVECFTQTSTKVNKDSSPQKLLFHQDVETHRKDIAPFFASMEPVSDMDFYRSLEQMSEIHKKDLQISRQSVIHHLYNLFIAHNKEDILMDFEDMEESKDLQFAAKLQEVFDLIGE